MCRVLVLSHADPGRTAGVLAYDVGKALLSKGHEVELVCNLPNSGSENELVIKSLSTKFGIGVNRLLHKIWLRVYRLFKIEDKNRTDEKYAVLEYDLTRRNGITNQILKRVTIHPDVIVVLFMQKFLTFRNLYELQERFGARTFLYMMDMAPLTGGCHYSWDCLGYEKVCGQCPAYLSIEEQDQSRRNWLFKKSFVEKLDIELMAGSELLLKQTMSSALFKNAPLHELIAPVSHVDFRPQDKMRLRAELDLPMDKQIIFFGANNVHDPRKGFAHLMEAFNLLKGALSEDMSRNVHLVLAGKVSGELNLPFSSTNFGHVQLQELSKLFSLSDIFACPSVQDSGPMMINQSLMCGTPVVAFKMGVAVDLVKTGVTGALVPLGNAQAFCEGLHELLFLSSQDKKEMSRTCRNIAVRKYSYPIFEERLSDIITGPN